MSDVKSNITNESTGKSSNISFMEVARGPQVLANIILGYIQCLTKFATLAIQGAFLLNTTAGITALIKLPASFVPVFLCAIGALCAVLCSGFAWQAQNYARNIDADNYRRAFSDVPRDDVLEHEAAVAQKRGPVWTWLALTCWFLSLLFFVLALVLALLCNMCR